MYPCTGKAQYLYNINQTIVFSIALIKLRKWKEALTKFGLSWGKNCPSKLLQPIHRGELSIGPTSTLIATGISVWPRSIKEWEMWLKFLFYLTLSQFSWEPIKLPRISYRPRTSMVTTMFPELSFDIFSCIWDNTTSTGLPLMKSIKTTIGELRLKSFLRPNLHLKDGELKATPKLCSNKLTEMEKEWFYSTSLLLGPSKRT